MKKAAKILLVDDNVSLLENLTEILRELDVDVAPATSASEALGLLSARTFDLVITDMRMPGVTGAELVRQIRELQPGLPTVIMTAYSGDAMLQSAWEQGVLAVLSKPVEVDELVRFVERAEAFSALVLFVDDDLDLGVNLTQALLEVDGVVPIRARSASEARRLVESLSVKTAIVDVRLPDGDGVALGRELQARFEDLHVVYITGHAAEMSETLADVNEAPDAHVLEKPFEVRQLLGVVQNILRTAE